MEEEPKLYKRNLKTGYWQNINSDGSPGSDTDRRTEPGHSSNVGRVYRVNTGKNDNNNMDWYGGGRKSKRSSRKRSHRNSKKSKRVRHTRRKQTRRHRHSRRR